ncbi:MBL fold metallo-hydrolase [Pullulanibacillus camelliae]|uniref:MBL fold metallo-hydrolase n=1 Tax=Pullulanibacillus camelliae TaxID=1707096 RepID=A0A8J2YLV5_9BACL|nr:MBL fold metallo-hydrolase [Pullulanibacillus camelliae]GGE51550.1 MBL fold metallo-hydrolase [Pullulanibacillus camelliae]
MDRERHYGSDYKYIPMTSIDSGLGMEVCPDVFFHTIQIVNILLIGHPESETFVLVDTGMPLSANKMISVVEKRFGIGGRPKAILLTHGHFDHVGAVIDLVDRWQVPVYAHEDEMPFLTGQRSYPEPDATVEGGMIAKLSPFFPHTPIDLGEYIKPLPSDGSVPHLPDFKWVHTPGHSPGHVSFFREGDRVLLAGDAFTTVKQEYLFKVMTQKQEISGPPRYLTTDWEAAKWSVMTLEALQPRLAITGHGLPMAGDKLARSLHQLVGAFDEMAVPKYGKYVN